MPKHIIEEPDLDELCDDDEGLSWNFDDVEDTKLFTPRRARTNDNINTRLCNVESSIGSLSVQLARVEQDQKNILEDLKEDRVDKKSLRNQIIAAALTIVMALIGATWKLSSSMTSTTEQITREVSARIERDDRVDKRIDAMTLRENTNLRIKSPLEL